VTDHTEPLHAEGNLILRGPDVVAMVMQYPDSERLTKLFAAAEELELLLKEALEHGCSERWRDAAKTVLAEVNQ
jgi:hypothetical protein